MTATASSQPGPAEPTAQPGPPHTSGFWILTLGTLGVVYGDIGTSPLYALKESLSAAAAGGTVTREMVFGIVSLILWALIFIVTIKYVLFILRADNNGEGGTLTLMALAQRAMGHNVLLIPLLGMIGAALFYGDAIITPAISVLSAVEGLTVASPAFEHYVLPLSLLILTGLFAVQSQGTARVAAWFGPITAVWFVLMAIGGLVHIADDPSILAAISPTYGVVFLATHGTAGLFALGAVFLAVTGAEALYADMGHFGRRPIQTAWLGLVLPCLALNYIGQGALLLADPAKIENPFFLLYPDWALLPMVGMATIATIIASQAVITGAFSITQQAIQLGLLPRMEIRWTSETEKGQIYVPKINFLLLVAVLLLVVMFRSSSALAHAYGLAVTGTMVVTAIMAFFVVWRFWKWSFWASVAVIAPFLAVDTIFLAANALKIPQGGWMPLLVGALLVLLMVTWRRGTRILFDKTRKVDVPMTELISMLQKSQPHRVKGTAVFMTSDPEVAPAALLHNLKHNKILHEKNVVLTVKTADAPRVADDERVRIESLGDSFWRVSMTYGYMEAPNIPRGLVLLRKQGFKFDIMATSFFVSRRSIRPSVHGGMPFWQDKLFISLAKSASDATDFFQIPTGRVVEVGTQVTV
ncbi:potassium transporter Kup [Microvirga lotononidis]|uniref:Probable potassium transport system protein Kup n=1 Tax=Microvirga lotononidis TaxID=864069 RepID=I4YPV0_9HYPH|nr:potassium transporter Kup [Microvirga lotononidis]EIM25992.1 K+ transporter [Microvirga lotononidis]WQO25901.1 potassium transporter Kup [Microvirga lotononidis]